MIQRLHRQRRTTRRPRVAITRAPSRLDPRAPRLLPDPPDSYSIAEAAMALGRTPDRIRNAIRLGALTASSRREWTEPRITRVALIEFCVAFGIAIH